MCGKKAFVFATTILCALAMSLVDGVVQPPYAVKSAIKILLFLCVPLGYFARFRAWDKLMSLFVLKKMELLAALGLGVGAFAVITGGYMVISQFFDLDAIIIARTSEGGVSAANFLYVSTYIALVNSLLEEFFFRGYAFLNMKSITSWPVAYGFSALMFALYHFGMVGGGNLVVSLVAMVGLFAAGLILNALNERNGSILTSWLLHMCANLAINTVGFYVFGML